MSADKRRTILIGFAGLAVILLAVIAIVSPSFRSEDASGAIGAVQKHRAPQIAKSDVILGDEQLRHEQKVEYTDFLNDAAALQSLSKDLSAAAAATESQARFAAIQAGVRARQKEAIANFSQEAENALGTVRRLAEADSAVLGSKKAAMMAEVENLSARARNFDALNNEEMNSIAMKLRDLDQSLSAARRMAFAESKSAMEAQSNLKQFENNLESARLAALLRAEEFYAGSMARQAAVLAEADASLALAGRDRNAAELIANEAQTLEAQAALGMKNALDNATAEYEMINSFSATAESQAQIESRRADAANRVNSEAYAQLNAISSHVRNAETLGVRASDTLGVQLRALNALASKTQYASMIRNADAFLNATSKQANVQTLDARNSK